MTDLKTVMSWLEGLTEDDWEKWYSNSEVQNTAKAAMELLKEQEAVKPRVDADGTFNCGNCGEPVGFDEHPFTCKVPEIAMKFCCECGKPVKWK